MPKNMQPESHPYDRSSKWLIQHHGDSILRLANIENIERWRPAQAEVVQPRQSPDGLLEVRLQGEPEDDLFLLEVATYPERRVSRQLTRDTMIAFLDRDELPEVIVLVLRPKGRYRIPTHTRLRSRRGFSACTVTRRVVELWKVSAERLLEASDVGLVPWAMIADSPDPPEQLARRCRDAIEGQAAPQEKENFLAVTQVLARLRYNDPGIFAILGGREIMIESPLIQEIVDEAVAEANQNLILDVLKERFGETSSVVEEKLRGVTDRRQLSELAKKAGTCQDVEDFRRALS
jgi:hypothetical protein